MPKRNPIHCVAALGLLGSGVLAAADADAVVTFNEIHYNPPALQQDGEWIELHNQMAVNIDMSGWALADGVEFTFPGGTVIPGGGLLVVAKNPGHALLAGVPGVLGPFTGSLSNGGETIELINPAGRLMDQLSYGDGGDWPVAADGAGATLAKRRPGSAADVPRNWRASSQPAGTPGITNFPSPDQPVIRLPIDGGSTWRFHDATSAPPGSWAAPGFDDSSWAQGQAAFGSTSATSDLGVTANLVARYRASAVTGVADGAPFSPWTDTATGDGVSQNAVAGGDPRFESNATASGEAAVSFGGDDEFRTSLSPGIGANSGFAYFLVCKATATPENGDLGGGNGDYLFDRDPAVAGNPLVSLKAVSGRYGFQKRFDDGSDLGGVMSTTAISTTQFQIVAVRRNRLLSRFEIWVDGTMEASTADSGGNLTPQPIVIGRHATIASNGFIGEIAELLVYRDELAEADFQSVGTYLEARYGLDTAFPDATANTELAAGASTAYFRKSFTYTGEPARTVLELNHTLSDGAVFYLNGQEIARRNMPAGAVGHTTSALSDVAPPLSSGFLTVPSAALVNGDNVLAVSLHTGAADNTAWFSASLRALETPVDPDLPPALELNEIAATGAPSFFIELRNPSGAAPASTSGFRIEVIGSQQAGVDLLAAVVPGGGVHQFTEAQLGFRPADGDKVILRAPGGVIADARVADAVARGRSGDWPGRWLFPASPTPGTANVFVLTHDIVINEVCYHPPELAPAGGDKQWLELRNRGATPVDLGGWSFDAGIGFDFPPGTILAAGGHLVIAGDPAGLTLPPGTTALGPWSGSLAHGGERLLLLDAAGNPADEVEYFDGGRWPAGADGSGSTLELRNPRADNTLPGSWSASDESARRSWQSYSYRAIATPSSVGPDGVWQEFIFGLLDSGEVLIDDISVVENPDSTRVPMITNGNFESGTTGWRFLGNHRHAKIIPDPGQAGNSVLRLDARGPTEHLHNHIETTLAAGVVNGRVYEISFRARWLGGSHLLNSRLYFNRVARTTELARSADPGTPGTPNSTAVANLGPGFTSLTHSPVVPAPGQSVTITTRAADPDGIGTLTLRYVVDGGSTRVLTMSRAADGATFTAVIPAQPAASVVRFYITATDATASPATSYFPADGASSRALYQVNEGLAATNGLHNVRIIMEPADEALLYQMNNRMSNERLGCTVIYDEREVYYDAGVRLKGSERGRPSSTRVGFNLGFNRDQLFRGIHRNVAIDRSDGQDTGCQEILYDHMMYASGGVPAEYNDLCKVIAPDPAHTSHAILQLARFGDVFLGSQFDNGGEGTVYEYELIYYPTTTDAGGYKLPQPDGVVGIDIVDLGDNKENYRWTYLIKNNENIDDYSRVMALAKQFSKSAGSFETGLDSVIDIDQWLRALAYSCACGAGDSFFANANHNGQFYARPSDGRVLYFPHDMDFSYSATRGILDNHELQKLTANGARLRAYLGHLHDICTTTFNGSYMSAWTNHYGALLPGENFPGHLTYIQSRSDYILGAINSTIAPVAFAITTNNGANFSTSTSPVTLAGQGWVNLREIRLAGSTVPLEVTWTTSTNWQVAVPVAPGPNAIALEAVDFSGVVAGTDSITVTNTGAIELPGPATLVVSEIYYNPPGDIETTEYVELLNTSAATLDLSNLSFTAGITFTFPGSSLLAAGGRILVVRDATAFSNAFGAGLPVAGTFSGGLDNSGEPIELRRADNVVLHSFAYADDPPWPVEADGDGYSLVLVDPSTAPDHADPLSWRASAVAGGSPGTSDTQSYANWKAANGGHGDDEDRDGDGYTTGQEYYLGGDPAVAEAGMGLDLLLEPGGSLLVSVTRRVAAEGASLQVEGSTDLTAWTPDPAAELVANQRLAGSPARDQLTFRVTPPPAATAFFVRCAFGAP